MEREDFPEATCNKWDADSDKWQVWDILRQLRLSERELLTLRYWVGLSDREIGVRLGITEKAVSSRFHRILEKCRKLAKTD